MAKTASFGLIIVALAAVGGACSTDRAEKDQKESAETPSSRRMRDGHEWTTDNLKINTDGSFCYADSEAHYRRYGRLYTWESAQRGCASLGNGWRLPTDDEWRGLAKHYGGVSEDSDEAAHAPTTRS